MKNLVVISIIYFTALHALSQTKEKEDQARNEFVFQSNMPDKLRAFYNQEEIRTAYRINEELNPFYLRGDFDGDKQMDFALAIIDAKSGKKGILIYHLANKKYFLAGAGKSIPNDYGDDYFWMDAWEVYDEKIVGQGVMELKPPKLKGEAILAQKLEASSGIIYWDGKEYRWYQQGD